MEAWRLKMESWRVCRQVVTDSITSVKIWICGLLKHSVSLAELLEIFPIDYRIE
jgi:hypothetical protein